MVYPSAGLVDRVHGDSEHAPSAIFSYDGLPERCGHMADQLPHCGVDHTTRRDWHDQRDRTGGVARARQQVRALQRTQSNAHALKGTATGQLACHGVSWVYTLI